MKIEIDMLKDPTSFKQQMLAVEKYIKENTIKVETTNFLGIEIASTPIIKTTDKNYGVKIELEDYWRKYHVSCKKTKGGIYKFKVWNAV